MYIQYKYVVVVVIAQQLISNHQSIIIVYNYRRWPALIVFPF